MAKLLITKGAHVNAQRRYDGNALRAALMDIYKTIAVMVLMFVIRKMMGI